MTHITDKKSGYSSLCRFIFDLLSECGPSRVTEEPLSKQLQEVHVNVLCRVQHDDFRIACCLTNSPRHKDVQSHLTNQRIYVSVNHRYVAPLRFFTLHFLFLFCCSSVRLLWLGLGTQTTLLGLGKHHSLAALVATITDGDGPNSCR